ncbi:tRNA pseudouridine(55) synthase TruB [Gallibacter intestinalis]|uniref:tRNA pseudouridine synthase B n=1 Tax=Gallibacter intestinalis TaxID=2779356 RepID=A0ABR9QXX7_9FIRM|nr:tRNA pseudouridine(55) synthase TruB [Gallibacter intestinalis]MBE5035732.1 tRNA pseudouridine(55) synthase TruB [Gallibacter intestinalis]
MDNINGVVVVNKPQNWTSHDCVAVVRRVIGVKRVGHTGTLDPMATGVLPVCVGIAARINEYLDYDTKTYDCVMKLGIITDTLDIWGEVLEERPVPDMDEAVIAETIMGFTGEISQIPPKYSALKVAGKKLYEYARAGQEVEIKPRKINIKHISVNNIDLENKEISFTVECSKGTYIRSLCADIGEKLGCGACMSGLVRTKTGVFTLDDTVDIEAVKKMSREELVSKLFPTDYPLVQFGRVELSANRAKDFVNGKKIPKRDLTIVRESSRDDFYNVYFNDTFLGVAKLVKGVLSAHKVFDVRMQNVSI